MIASTLILCDTYITIPLGALKTRLCRGCALWMRCPNSGNVWPLRPQVGLVSEVGPSMSSHSPFLWAMFEDMFGPPKKWPWSSSPLWSDMASFSRAFQSKIVLMRGDPSHESNLSHQKFLWKLQNSFTSKKWAEGFGEEWVRLDSLGVKTQLFHSSRTIVFLTN